MKFTGRYEISASPERAWDALNDASVLQSCVLACEKLTRRDGRYFDVVAVLRIGPIRPRFRAVIEQSEIAPPNRCVLKVEGRCGATGFGRGEAIVFLAPSGTGTILTYTAKAAIGGKLARIGQRLIDGAAQRVADDFFSRITVQIANSPVVPVEVVVPVEPERKQELVASQDTVRREGLAPEIWVIGLIAVIVVLLILFGVTL
jgi:carbon monoxide dehydrogenase subunit G